MSKKPKTTEKQKKAVNGILAGKKPKDAMLAAGYSKKSAEDPKRNFLELRGVQAYLSKFDEAALEKFNMNLQDLVIDTYLNGTKATKLVGRDAIEHPDHKTRLTAAEKLAEFLGWTSAPSVAPQMVNNNYNFFSVDKRERDDLNRKMVEFLDGVLE